jgi:hypothetical protein
LVESKRNASVAKGRNGGGVAAADPGTDDKPDITGKPVPTEPQSLDIATLVELATTPPPLNTLLRLAGLGRVGAAPDIVGSGQVVALSIGASRGGLNPPTKSSVEPRGIPEPLTGDVRSIEPSAGVVTAPDVGEALRTPVCAGLGSLPSSATMATIAHARPNETSVCRNR